MKTDMCLGDAAEALKAQADTLMRLTESADEVMKCQARLEAPGEGVAMPLVAFAATAGGTSTAPRRVLSPADKAGVNAARTLLERSEQSIFTEMHAVWKDVAMLANAVCAAMPPPESGAPAKESIEDNHKASGFFTEQPA